MTTFDVYDYHQIPIFDDDKIRYAFLLSGRGVFYEVQKDRKIELGIFPSATYDINWVVNNMRLDNGEIILPIILKDEARCYYGREVRSIVITNKARRYISNKYLYVEITKRGSSETRFISLSGDTCVLFREIQDYARFCEDKTITLDPSKYVFEYLKDGEMTISPIPDEEYDYVKFTGIDSCKIGFVDGNVVKILPREITDYPELEEHIYRKEFRKLTGVISSPPINILQDDKKYEKVINLIRKIIQEL